MLYYIIMLLIVLVVIVPSFLLYSYVDYKLKAGKTLTEEQRKKIKENGLIHFTSFDNGYSIIKSGVMYPSKGYFKTVSNGYKPCCYFFIGDDASDSSIRFNVGGKKIQIKLAITDIPEEVIEKLKYRKRDGAIIYPNAFPISSCNVRMKEDTPKSYKSNFGDFLKYSKEDMISGLVLMGAIVVSSSILMTGIVCVCKML